MKKILILSAIWAFSFRIFANDLSISNVRLLNQNTSFGFNNTNNYSMVSFDMSWENSWRVSAGPTNWDAVWVFVKFRVSGGNWQHAFLHQNGHIVPSAAESTVGLRYPDSVFHTSNNPGLGVFLYRKQNGAGTFSMSNVQLRWNYTLQGLSDTSKIDLQVLGIEMVYVPQASYYVGDGSVTNVEGNFRNATTNTPFLISSESALTLGGNTDGNLCNNNASGMFAADDFNNTQTQSLSASFPKGYNAFYCMKYEITQGQYRDFLNLLTRSQQANRFSNTTVGAFAGGVYWSGSFVVNASPTIPYNRIGLRLISDGGSPQSRTYACDLNNNQVYNESSDGESIAMGQLSWFDLLAYLDWSGLRPMTELEFEKACRGPNTPVPNEYAWGTTTIVASSGISNAGTANEVPSNLTANAVHANVSAVYGPMRVGCFANNSSTRSSAGATYYGIMEMSGNLWERVVPVGHSWARPFTGIHGNGALSNTGNANESFWPGWLGGEVVFSLGAGFKGGLWVNGNRELRVSSRIQVNDPNGDRITFLGGRGVRTAPTF